MLREAANAIRSTVLNFLPTTHTVKALRDFYSLIQNYPNRPGKSIRGLATLKSTEAHGVPWQQGIPAAAGIEVFQSWVLIHDDIEDNSESRRGLPTLHKEVGIPVALNVGDALHAYMWDLLISLTADHAMGKAILKEFVWIIHRTSEGQHLDLTWVGEGRFDIAEQDYLTMVYLKTACYTVVGPLRLGALSAGKRPADGFLDAGKLLGCAFQIRDDILNLTPNATIGKEFAGDLYEAKRTLILAHLFDHAALDERTEIVERLSRPRRERTEDDVTRILALIKDYDSLNYAQDFANRLARRGLATLTSAFPDPANHTAFHQLKRLFRSLVTRDS
jgi:geranylgeranyl diphosphate synthase type II